MQIEIVDNSDKFIDAMEDAVLRALARCGMQGEGYAKDLCPVDTGLLINSITYAIGGEGAAISKYSDDAGERHGYYSGTAPEDDKNECSVYIGTNVEYGSYVELGTNKTDAQPYIKPAVADHAETYKNIINDEMNNG